jgi:5'-nucleotidase
MRILVTNDDGIHGPGLVTLEKIAAQFTDEVWTVAPETDQSGSAHSLTLSDPLRLREVGERRYALRGTPTDCVIMAVRHVMPSPPDLVLSGVNRGQNVADDIGYSGTVAGAMEGTVLGIRSIALSQATGPDSRLNPHYATAEALAPRIIQELLAETWPSGILYNLNFPAVPAERVTGFEVTVQGKRDQQFLAIDGRIDGRGMPYYWIAYSASRFETPLGTDIRAVAEGRVSVTPLRLDLTAHDLVGRLASRFGGRAVGL